MELLILGAVSFVASLLTFFSGFGLNTLLLPAMFWFFEPAIAIVVTALIHFSNNLFKLLLIGKQAKPDVVVRFGLPAVVAAFVGAFVMTRLFVQESHVEFSLWHHVFTTTNAKLVLGSLLILFAIVEIINFKFLRLSKRWLPVGGLLSGFFGGLSGYQGAFRSIFLLRAGLDKTEFIATGIWIACLVDIARLAVYQFSFFKELHALNPLAMLVALLAAVLASILGQQLLRSVTFSALRYIIVVLLLLTGTLLALGIL